MMTERTRVLVAGGGPAGSMTAMLLAREGFDVVVCEKDRFPRYHIGESLLTSVIPLLEFVGALERVERHGFVKKYGAFFRIKHDQPAGYIDFTKLSRYPHSFQVLRSEFDAILLDHARTAAPAFSNKRRSLRWNSKIAVPWLRPRAVPTDQAGESPLTTWSTRQVRRDFSPRATSEIDRKKLRLRTSPWAVTSGGRVCIGTVMGSNIQARSRWKH